MNLSRRIRDLRYAKGWGPDELASRAKISRTALYQIERGNTSKPQAGTLRRISRALGVPLEVLLETTPVSSHEPATESAESVMTTTLSATRPGSSDRGEELLEKFRLLLTSPMAEGVARIVEESYRLLPIIPSAHASEPQSYAAPVEFDGSQRGRARSSRAE